MAASMNENVDTVLINAGARLEDANDDGWTALHYAAKHTLNNQDIIRL